MKRTAKNLLSLALALSLALTLMVPAGAAEGWPPPDYTEFQEAFVSAYEAEHSQEYAAFDADAYFRSSMPWWTKDEYLKAWGLTEEEFRQAMWEESLSEKSAEAYEDSVVNAYRAAFPGKLEKLDLSKLLAARGYLEPLTAYMEDGGYANEAEARDGLYAAYAEDRAELARAQETGKVYEADHPGSRAAFDADAYFAEKYFYYSDKEEFMAARSLENETEFAEYLFANWIEYQNIPLLAPDLYPWSSDGPIALVANGETVELPEELPVYLEAGVTYAPAETLSALLNTKVTGDSRGYAPVRAAAEAAGWDVSWNERWHSVVLLDKEAIQSGLEKEFEKIDELFSRLWQVSMPADDGAYFTTSTANIQLTAFNTLDGNTTATASVKSELVQQGNLLDLTLTVDAAGLLKLMTSEMREKLDQSGAKLSFNQLKTLITGCKVRVICNFDEGTAYVNLPFLADFVDGAKADTWYGFDMGFGGMSMDELRAGFGISEMLYDDLLASSTSGWKSPAGAYADFSTMKAQMATLFGNNRIKESGGTMTYTFTTDMMNEMLSAAVGGWGETEIPDLFKDYRLSISVSKNGRMEMSAAIRPDINAMAGALGSDFAQTATYTFLMGLLDMRMTASASGDADSGSGRTEFHWKNQFRLDVNKSYTRGKTTREPAAEPPVNADVQMLFSQYDGGPSVLALYGVMAG